jgi:uncharacterized protein involved in exopolysaccharide biosynthesis
MKSIIARTAVLVAALGFLFVGLYHTLAPTRYEAVARVDLEEILPAWSTNYNPNLLQDQIDLIRSEQVLGKVREKFRLRNTWGEPQKEGQLATPGPTELDVTPVRCTRFIDIRTSAAGQREAAGIANAIVEAWQKYNQPDDQTEEAQISVQVLVPATPPPRASFPNRYLGVAALLLGGLLIVGWRFFGVAKAIGRPYECQP